jgi:hypothetical protein
MNPRDLMRAFGQKRRLTTAALDFFQQGFHIEQGERLEEGPQVPKVEFLDCLLCIQQIVVIAAHERNGGLNVLAPKLLQDMQSGNAWHQHIQKNDICVSYFVGLAGAGVQPDHHVMSQTGQKARESCGKVRVILYDDDPTLRLV